MDQIAATLVFRNHRTKRPVEQVKPLSNVVSAAMEMLAEANEVYTDQTIPGIPTASWWLSCVIGSWLLLCTFVLCRDNKLAQLTYVLIFVPLVWVLLQWLNDRYNQDIVHRFGDMMVPVATTPEARAMDLLLDPAQQFKVDACLGGLLGPRWTYPSCTCEESCLDAYTKLCAQDAGFCERPQEEQVFAVALKAIYDLIK